jgi:hypothetical protein
MALMQVATTQAARALAALRSSRRRGPSRRRRRARPARVAAPLTVERAIRHIESLPPVRHDRVTAARRRVSAGEHPSAGQIADMVVRRTLCDSVR